MPAAESDRRALDGVVVVLQEPQDLVNVALVIRAMKNMGLRRLRLVRPAEFDAYRITGIAHGTEDLVEGAEILPDLDAALVDASWVVGTSVRRRASRQQWWEPEGAATRILDRSREAPVALLFGPEDRGLSNRALDRCHALIAIPTDPDHPSMNLAHAALLIFWELRKAVGEGVPPPELAPKRRRSSPPATAEELEAFFEAWEAAMEAVGFFHHVDPLPKMRSFRSIFQRADPDRRELGLLQAAAYEILHHARRERIRAREEAGEG